MNAPSGGPDNLDRSVGRSAFGVDPSGYDGARSGYPEELFDHLSNRSAANPRILEIGAGTGLATQGLKRCQPRELTLVEPDPRLCSFLRQCSFGVESKVVCGPFPEARIEGPFDLITCAAAFHWMEPAAALSRIQELLAPGGIWAMWWNCYFGHGEPDPFGEAVTQILDAHNVSLPPSYRGRRHYALDTALQIGQLEAGGFRDIEHRIFITHRILNAGQARALYETFSFIQALPHDTQASIFGELTELVESEFSGNAQSIVVTSMFSALV